MLSSNDSQQDLQQNQGGSLQVPKNAKILYVEPAIKGQVNIENAYFFEKPPSCDNYPADNIYAETIQVTSDFRITQIRKQVGQEFEDLILHDDGVLKKATNVLIRPFEYNDPAQAGKWVRHPFLYQVTTYKSSDDQQEDPDMPESGNKVELGHVGYMFQNNIISEENFKPSTEVLFPHPPTTEDIVQAEMGDCFLLSTINAILAKGDEGVNFIQGMMQEQEDGSVVVRLFDPRTKEPVFVRVEKSVHHKDGKCVVKHKALWVSILEKAYAGLAFREYSKSEKHASISTDYIVGNSSFLHIFGGGGLSHVAHKVLTGEDADTVELKDKITTVYPMGRESQELIGAKAVALISQKVFSNANLIAQLDEWAKDKSNYSKIEKEIVEIVNDDKDSKWIDVEIEKSKFYSIFADVELLKQWGIYLFIVSFFYQDAYTALTKLKFDANDREQLNKDLKELEKLTPTPPTAVLEKFRGYIEKPIDGKGIYHIHGPALSGQYTAEEIALYAELEEAINQGKTITTGTQREFKEDGLRNRHAYSIVKVEEINNVKYVRLRNPWGHTGRKYSIDDNNNNNAQTKAEEVEDAEFNLDLRDFAIFFRRYTAGFLPTQKAIKDIVDRPQAVAEKKYADTFYCPFEMLGDESQYDVISKLITLSVEELFELLKLQSPKGLVELQLAINEQINNMERSLINHPEHKIVFMDIKNRRRLLGALCRYNLREYKHITGDPASFSAVHLEKFEVKEIKLRSSFSALKNDEERDNYVFRLVGLSYASRYLGAQSDRDLSNLIKYLKKSISKKTKLYKKIKQPNVKNIALRHLAREEAFLKFVEKKFVHRLQSSSSYNAYNLIKSNADAYIKMKKKQSFWYRIKHPIKTLFESKETEIYKTYRRHLKFHPKKKSTMDSTEMLVLAKEYLIGQSYSIAGMACFERVSDLCRQKNSKEMRADAMTLIELEKTGEDFQLCIYNRGHEVGYNSEVLILPRTDIENYAKKQLQYRTSILAKIAASNESTLEVAERYFRHTFDDRVLPAVIRQQLKNYDRKLLTIRVLEDEISGKLSLKIQAGQGSFVSIQVPARVIENLAIAEFEYNEFKNQAKLPQRYSKTLSAIEAKHYDINELALNYLLHADSKIPSVLKEFLQKPEINKSNLRINDWDGQYVLGDISSGISSKLSIGQVQEFAVAQFYRIHGMGDGGILGQIARLKLNVIQLACEQLREGVAKLRFIGDDKIEDIHCENPSDSSHFEFKVKFENRSKIINLTRQQVESLAVQRFETKMQTQDYFVEDVRRFRL